MELLPNEQILFNEMKEKRNLLICIHPLILSSIATSIVGTLLYEFLIENAF